MNIKTLSFGCRLNALESEKIAKKLSDVVDSAILVNTCSVTGEAERQSAQAVRKLSRENPMAIIFVTGCGATRNPELFEQIPRVLVINNTEKMDVNAYVEAINVAGMNAACSQIDLFKNAETPLSKQFIQVQNGCNHDCTYCVTRLLRGRCQSFPYVDILNDAKSAVANGFYEVVLTGVDTASYMRRENDELFLLGDLCAALLRDVPEIQRLRLSSIDPASPEVPKIIKLMHENPRFMPHLHLSMQSGSDKILTAMRRRHNADKLCEIAKMAGDTISLSADIICGFPGETDELFNETANMVREMGIIHAHAFPFSPRPNTVAADMPNQVARNVAKQRVKIISDIAEQNRIEFMNKQIGKVVSVLVEEKNIGRTPDDIDVKIGGKSIPNKTICDVEIVGIKNGVFAGKIVK